MSEREPRRIVLVGDACCPSGFARCTHTAADAFHRAGWHVAVVGINYHGNPHRQREHPYPVYPSRDPYVGARDAYGVQHLPYVVHDESPDVILVMQDPWNIPPYIRAAGNVPIIGWLAVDGKNVDGRDINGLDGAIFWTRFGEVEATSRGYNGPTAVVPLGVDVETFYPRGEKADLRSKLGIPPRAHDAFVVGRVDRNQRRKRWDLMVSYFADWVREYDVPDAYLFAHLAPTGEAGFDVAKLMDYYGMASRLIVSEPGLGRGISPDGLATTYSALDLAWTTTQGEGWGLGTMEAMACGTPALVPDWSALGEWTEGAAFQVPCSHVATTAPNNSLMYTLGGIADREATIEALNTLYQDEALRADHAERGLELVRRPEYRWEAIGDRVVDVVCEMLYPDRMPSGKRSYEATPADIAAAASGGG